MLKRQLLYAIGCLTACLIGCDSSPRQGVTSEKAPQQPPVAVDPQPDDSSRPDSPTPSPAVDPQPVATPDSPAPADPARTPEAAVPVKDELIEGRLQGGIVGIGAETTGWVIVPHNEQGNLAAIEVDVSAFGALAERLDGGDVRAWGVYTVKAGIERGKMRVFVIRKIESAK